MTHYQPRRAPVRLRAVPCRVPRSDQSVAGARLPQTRAARRQRGESERRECRRPRRREREFRRIRSRSDYDTEGPLSNYLSDLRPDFSPSEIECGKIGAYQYERNLKAKARRPWLAATVCVYRPAYSMPASGRDESPPYIPDGGYLPPLLPSAGEKSGLERSRPRLKSVLLP